MDKKTKKLIKQEEKSLKKRQKLQKSDSVVKEEPKEELTQEEIERKKQLAEEISNKIVANIDGSGNDELFKTEGDSEETVRAKRKRRIHMEQQKELLNRQKYMKENQMVEAVVPVRLQEKFLYYTTTIQNIERQLKKLRRILVLCLALVITFLLLYMYEKGETKRTYERICNRAVEDVIDTMTDYVKNPADGDRFSRMITGETNMVRMAAEEIDISTKYTNKLNDVYHLMVDYPVQMETKYEKMIEIYSLLKKSMTDKKAYDEIDQLMKEIDKLGE